METARDREVAELGDAEGRGIDLVDFGRIRLYVATDDAIYGWLPQETKNFSLAEHEKLIAARKPRAMDGPSRGVLHALARHYWHNGLDFRVLDIGSQYGLVALETADYIKRAGKQNLVVGFEPGPAGPLFRRNIDLNRLDDLVTFEPMAVSNSNLPILIYTEPGHTENSRIVNGNAGAETLSYSVPATTIDNYAHSKGIKEHLILKIDTQGAEYEVLAGMNRVMAGRHCCFVMEFTPWALSSRVDPTTWIAELARHYYIADLVSFDPVGGREVRWLSEEALADFVNDVSRRESYYADVLVVPKNLPNIDSLKADLAALTGTEPYVASLVPDGGSGSTQAFACAYNAFRGFRDLRSVHMMFAAGVDRRGEPYAILEYDALGNSFWLRGDDDFVAGPVKPGARSNTLQNEVCAIDTSSSDASGDGEILTVTANVVFKAAGDRNIYLRAQSVAGFDTGWVRSGKWTMSPAPARTMSVSPASGEGTVVKFTLTYPDPPEFAGLAFGWADFQVRAPSEDPDFPRCLLHYDRAGNGLWLYSGNGCFVGPIAPGQPGVLDSPACSLNTSETVIVNAGGNLTMIVPITMKSTMSGPKLIFQRSLDLLNRDSGWQQTGTWTIP